jgi:hypothetical protein
MCGRVTSFLKLLYELLVNKEQFLTEDITLDVYETAACQPVEPVESNRYNLRARNKVNYAETTEFID